MSRGLGVVVLKTLRY